MFPSLPKYLNDHGLNADVRTLLLLRRAMDRGLAKNLGDLYILLKSLVCAAPTDFGPYTAAFYAYFLDMPVKQGERLESAVLRSQTFQEWRKKQMESDDFENKYSLTEWVEQFLDQVHQSSLDIQSKLSGADILEKDKPDMPDNEEQGNQAPDPKRIQEMADYSDISLEELLERMKRVAAQQRSRHFGGRHWIGQGGISPYGNGGAAAGGIRVGGAGGGKMARAVMNDSRFFPADVHALLRDDNIDAALAALKGIKEESTEILLDIPQTIQEGSRSGGIFLPITKEKVEQKVQVILLIDNGGYSMSPYVQAVQRLFSKMKTRFAHDLKTYYFHNTIYGGAYSDVRRQHFVPVDTIADTGKNYALFVVGDADMAPYELDGRSIQSWQVLLEAFPKKVWLNPSDPRWWNASVTIATLARLFPMHPLSPSGIEAAVLEMNRKGRGGNRKV